MKTYLSIYHNAWHMLKLILFCLSLLLTFSPFSRNPLEYSSIVICYTILSTFIYIFEFPMKIHFNEIIKDDPFLILAMLSTYK